MNAFRMGPEVFAILSAFVEERSGLHYEASDAALFSEKVEPRAVAAGFDTALDYYYFLRYDEAGAKELDALVEALVVHETYFFRESYSIEAAVETILRPLVLAGRRPRIWSAACSTGEEPLTLAMMLADRGLLHQASIVASDVSDSVLAKAKSASYRARSLRLLPAGVRGRWLEGEGDVLHVRQELRDAIEWRRVNLVDPKEIAALGAFNLILCRNVLIYFKDSTIARVTTALASALAPDGYILLGASESLLRFGTLLECEERGGAFFYRCQRSK